MYPAGTAAVAIIAVTVATTIVIKKRQQASESLEDSDLQSV
jgi:hypothetical protein